MGYFQVRYDSRVVNYDRRGFIRLATVGSKAAESKLGDQPYSDTSPNGECSLWPIL